MPHEAGAHVAEDAPPLSKPNFDVSGMNFIVTGGTGTLGKSIACSLSAHGAKGIILSGMAEEGKAKEACCKVYEAGGDERCAVHMHMSDLSDPKSCEELVSFAKEKLGEINGLINSAATNCRGSLDSTSLECFDRIMKTNLRAPWLLTKLVACHMKEKNIHGSILNISALESYGGTPKLSTYSISKAALNGMTKIHAHELKQYRIRVNAVTLGLTVTEQEAEVEKQERGEDWVEKADKESPMGRILRPIDVSACVGFLMSESAAMITGDVICLAPECVPGCWG